MRKTLRFILGRPVVFYPLLFAMYPILFFYAHNIEQITREDTRVLLIAMAITVALTALLWLLLSVASKDKKKAALIVSLGLVLFFSYGHFARLIQWLGIVEAAVFRHKVLLIIWGIAFLLGAYLTLRMRGNLTSLTKALNVMAVALVAISFVNIGTHLLRGDSGIVADQVGKHIENSPQRLDDRQAYPDIYYIVLDSYASARTLDEVYSYDNHEFYEYLTDRGFFIAEASHSNYPTTFLSLASSLNMQYVNDLSDLLGVESTDRAVPYQMVKQSEAMEFLRSRGYEFIHFSSGWGATNRNEFADRDMRYGVLSEALTVFIQTTMAGPFMGYFMQDDHAQRVLYTFSELASVPGLDGGPKFAFAHILCPHPPYVFDADGRRIPQATLEMTGHVWEQKDLYLDQLSFVNKKVEILVDVILSRSEICPIIILQADHGTASTFYVDGTSDRASPAEHMLRERLEILNAYHLPQGGDSLLYDSITPVNTFRLIFDFYFGTDHGLLDDYYYYSTYDRPYDLVDVTDQLRQG